MSHSENKTFSSSQDLRAHERIHTGEGPGNLKTLKTTSTRNKPYNCSHCDYTTSWISGLRRHEIRHTNEAFSCTQCEKKFSNLTNLRIHERIRTGKKLYHCSQCDYNSNAEINIRGHERIHTGERPFKCDLLILPTLAKGI